MNVVVLLAGGIGRRMKSTIPKQHLVMNEHQIIEYTLHAFSRSEVVDYILIVSNKDYIETVESMKSMYPKLKWVIKGGDTRIRSAYNAVCFLSSICKPADKIIVSDAARPCITLREIKELFVSLERYKAVTTGLESYETLLNVDKETIKSVIPRDGIYRQTSPEGYRFGALKEMYIDCPISVVDNYRNIGIDNMVMRGEKIAVIKSNTFNFKITTKEDIYLFEYVLSKGFDAIIEMDK